MRNDLYGLKVLARYIPNVEPQPTDLVSAEFCVIGFRDTYARMTREERNSMRERHWYRDPGKDAWVYCPPYFWENSRNNVNSSEISGNNDEESPVTEIPAPSAPLST